MQWERPGLEDALEPFSGITINGKKPYEKGDEFIPEPPPPKMYDGPLSDTSYKASTEELDEVFPADEDLLDACLECDLEKLKTALADGADVSLPNYPWSNTPLHLANAPAFWDLDSLQKEKDMRLAISQYLVRQGADLEAENTFRCKPIDLAVFHNYPATVEFLQGAGAKLGWFGAAYRGDLTRIKELLEDGQDIDLQGRYRRTAFAEAHLRGQWVVAMFLAQQGCSREMFHSQNIKFNPGGAAIPRGNLVPKRQKPYYREDDPEWYDDMMEKRFPGYQKTMKLKPK